MAELLILTVAAGYLLAGYTTARWQARQLPTHAEMSRRYAELAYIFQLSSQKTATLVAVLAWPGIVLSVAIWGWPEDGTS